MNLIKRILYIVLFNLIVSLLLIELIFQFLPVSDSLITEAVNESEPYIHFKPNRLVRTAVGADFKKINVKKIFYTCYPNFI